MKYDAVEFSFAGDKYIGRSYTEMDCQAFVERCMANVGLSMNLAGSNAWYREVQKHGWVGSPEECLRYFGIIPKGALLFILKQDGKEPGKYRGDGIGNASHIGIVIQRREGAIHSSSSKGKVCYSKFAGKTIPGGWNRIGLYDRFDYGKTINWLLEHGVSGQQPEEKEETPMAQAVAKSENGKVINLRKSADRSAALVDQVPSGTSVGVIMGGIMQDGEEWSKVTYKGKTGYMMSRFLVADDTQLPDEDPDDFEPVDAGDQDGAERITLTFSAAELSAALPVLMQMTQQIIDKVGRG